EVDFLNKAQTLGGNAGVLDPGGKRTHILPTNTDMSAYVGVSGRAGGFGGGGLGGGGGFGRTLNSEAAKPAQKDTDADGVKTVKDDAPGLNITTVAGMITNSIAANFDVAQAPVLG